MATTIARFTLPPSTTRTQGAERFKGSAPRDRALPGLVRKYSLLSEQGPPGGGVCRMRREGCGVEPEVTCHDCPVLVDNVTGKISSAPGYRPACGCPPCPTGSAAGRRPGPAA